MSEVELVIKIPENVKIAIDRMGLLRIPDEMIEIVDKAIQRSTPLKALKQEKSESEEQINDIL